MLSYFERHSSSSWGRYDSVKYKSKPIVSENPAILSLSQPSLKVHNRSCKSYSLFGTLPLPSYYSSISSLTSFSIPDHHVLVRSGHLPLRLPNDAVPRRHSQRSKGGIPILRGLRFSTPVRRCSGCQSTLSQVRYLPTPRVFYTFESVLPWLPGRSISAEADRRRRVLVSILGIQRLLFR